MAINDQICHPGATGSLPPIDECARTSWQRIGGEIRIAQPSGVSTLGAVVAVGPPAEARSVTVSRTARRLMEGRVLVPRARLSAAAERAA